RGERRPADGLRLPDRRARARARDDLRGADQERLRALPARREAARLPQPLGRPRVGAAHARTAAAGLLRERPPGHDVRGHARSVRDLLRDDRRAGVRLGRRGRHLDRDRAGPPAGALGGGAGAAMSVTGSVSTVRLLLPYHLRSLAGVGGEVELGVPGTVTQRSVLDALEARYPQLRGTIRDHATQRRRAFVRFFACAQDLSHESPDTPLPDDVAS